MHLLLTAITCMNNALSMFPPHFFIKFLCYHIVVPPCFDRYLNEPVIRLLHVQQSEMLHDRGIIIFNERKLILSNYITGNITVDLGQ